MKKIIGFLVILLVIGLYLQLGNTTPQKFGEDVELKDPTKVLAPLAEKLPKVELPKVENTNKNNNGNKEVLSNNKSPREEVPTLTKSEIIDKEYVLKVEPKLHHSYYKQLFETAQEDKQAFTYKKEEKPTITYVKLNKTSIERNYGNQQSFDENPIGWNKNKQVDIPHDRLGNYHGWFWNRSHLVADQLGGESIMENAITGTRTQNVGGRNNKGGMRVPEERAYNYIKETGKPLLYYVDVVYYEDNHIIPSEVRVTLYNDEIYEQYVTYNVANGYNIDYVNGTFSKE